MCGECCRAGYKVSISRKDVEKWSRLNKKETINYLIIDTDCLSINLHKYLNSDKISKSIVIREKINNFKTTHRELEKFIKKTHLYCGQNPMRKKVKTILTEYDHDPILAPKDSKVILKGLEVGLEYKINIGSLGRCPFLCLNACSIQECKPDVCRRFPYTKSNCLRNDDFFKSICEAI